jgi:hypothetical protein
MIGDLKREHPLKPQPFRDGKNRPQGEPIFLRQVGGGKSLRSSAAVGG